ncbi:MAG: helix-turn-helix transcriptional regulator [Bdellovibrionales bacterium]|nr:helix-turn-helix transcriptional regulator [Bdellovibrionales bacterium]
MSPVDRLPEDMGSRLQKLLQEKHYTASQVAQALNIPKATFSCWIGRGGRFPQNPLLIKQLAEFLGVSLSYLIAGIEETPTPAQAVAHSSYRFEVTIRPIQDSTGGAK